MITTKERLKLLEIIEKIDDMEINWLDYANIYTMCQKSEEDCKRMAQAVTRIAYGRALSDVLTAFGVSLMEKDVSNTEDKNTGE